MRSKPGEKIHKRRGFEFGYIAKPEQMNGAMLPEFKPTWWVQYLGDGTQAFFKTRRECLDWIREWRDISR